MFLRMFLPSEIEPGSISEMTRPGHLSAFAEALAEASAEGAF